MFGCIKCMSDLAVGTRTNDVIWIHLIAGASRRVFKLETIDISCSQSFATRVISKLKRKCWEQRRREGCKCKWWKKKWKEDWSQANSWKWAVHLAGAHLEAESGWSLFLRILNFMPVSSRFKEGLFPSFQSFDGAVFQSVHVKWNSRQEKQHRYRWVSCLCESNCNKADCHASWDSMPPLSSLFPSWKGVASVSEVLLPGWVWLILQQPTSSLQFPTASTLCGAAVMFELGKDQGAHKADSQATYIYNFSTWYVDNFRMVAIWVPPKLATWP